LHVKSDSEEALNNSLARAIEVLELE